VSRQPRGIRVRLSSGAQKETVLTNDQKNNRPQGEWNVSSAFESGIPREAGRGRALISQVANCLQVALTDSRSVYAEH
jgi:hypothetical protein